MASSASSHHADRVAAGAVAAPKACPMRASELTPRAPPDPARIGPVSRSAIAQVAIAWPNVGGARSVADARDDDACRSSWRACLAARSPAAAGEQRILTGRHRFGVGSAGTDNAGRPGRSQALASKRQRRRVTSWRISIGGHRWRPKRSVTVGRFGIGHAAGDQSSRGRNLRISPSRGSS